MAYVHAYFCTDIPDLGAWKPANLSDVYVGVSIYIGSERDGGADIFQVLIATPEGMRVHAKAKVISGRHTIIVLEYDWAAIRAFIEDVVNRSAAGSWPETAARIARHFLWEYENYSVGGRNRDGSNS